MGLRKICKLLPTRALDACHLIGNQRIFDDYKHAFFNELGSAKSEKALKAFKKDAVCATLSLFKRTVAGSNASHIDVAKGLVIYDGERIKGVKYPFLRTIQYKLGMHVFILVQAKKLDEKSFLEMPHSTLDRIKWLAERNFIKINSEEVKTFQKAYIVSLIWSGISQKKFEVLHQKETVIASKELK